MAVIHRGEITKVARECRLGSQGLIVKYGFAGRVLLGPKGRPGPIRLPILIHVTDDARQILRTEKSVVTVTVPQERPFAYFSQVQTITLKPTPERAPGDYRLFITFDRNAPGAG